MKQIVYVDMDGVLVDFQSGIDRLADDAQAQYDGHYDDAPGIFALMDPKPDAIASYRELAGLFETYILSTSPWKNPSAWSDKVLWVQRYLGDVAHKRLILTHHKNLNAGDYLIDDRSNHGAESFGDRLILFGSAEYPDWPAVMKHMRGVAGGA
jgi:5'-nucleotidase